MVLLQDGGAAGNCLHSKQVLFVKAGWGIIFRAEISVVKIAPVTRTSTRNGLLVPLFWRELALILREISAEA